MIIRATSKLLHIEKIVPVKKVSAIEGPLPGEWYASLVATGPDRKESSAIHFAHNPTTLSVVVMGQSLSKAIEVLPLRAAAVLRRHGFAELVDRFALDSACEIYTTNDRSFLATMNQMRYSIEWHFAMAEELEPSVLQSIEDSMIKYLAGGKVAQGEKYIQPLKRLSELL